MFCFVIYAVHNLKKKKTSLSDFIIFYFCVVSLFLKCYLSLCNLDIIAFSNTGQQSCCRMAVRWHFCQQQCDQESVASVPAWCPVLVTHPPCLQAQWWGPRLLDCGQLFLWTSRMSGIISLQGDISVYDINFKPLILLHGNKVCIWLWRRNYYIFVEACTCFGTVLLRNILQLLSVCASWLSHAGVIG